MSGLNIYRKLAVKYDPDLRIVFVACLFYLSAYLGYYLAFDKTTGLPTWPPSGIAFALVILLGRKAWPGIMIGALLSNLMAFWNEGLTPPAIISLSVLIATANTLEALLGNLLIKEWVRDDYPFRNTRNAFRFLFVTLFMCVVGSAIGTFSLFSHAVIEGKIFITVGLAWWVRNAVGILLFTPFILACHHYILNFRLSREKMIELAGMCVLSIALISLARIDLDNQTLVRALPFLIIPILLWLAFRFELFIAISSVLVVSLVSIYITTHGAGPFVLPQPGWSMLLLQIFLGVMSITTLVLSATVTERAEAQRKLKDFNENLEAKVHQRTKALNEEIDTRKYAEAKLQRSNEELSKRNTELDNFVYSVSHDLRAPIASVLGLINLAKKDKDINMKDVYLDMVNQSALQQDHFIREILDQSRNSRLEVKREEIFFKPIIEETFNQLKFATAAGQAVERVVTVDQQNPFYCDRWRLRVILNNIISNSIRYRNGQDPVIRVNVQVNQSFAHVEIEDNGKGIGKEHLNNVFNMFYRGTDDGAGSGLGLYIVKETMDKLNGSIKIDSEVGRGTRVSLRIPEVAVLN